MKTSLLFATCLVIMCSTSAAYSKIQVCHIPPGQPDKVHVIQVGSEDALEAHLSHGDKVFGVDLNSDCQGGVSIQVDDTIAPSRPDLPGLAGGEPRPIGVFVGPDGRRDEYVENEIEFAPENEQELQSLLIQYGGEVIRDNVALVMTDDRQIVEEPGGGWVLIRFNPQTSSLFDLPELMTQAGVAGAFRFSSEAAARALALVLREKARTLTLNIVLEPLAILEHPDDSGGHLDFSTPYFWWMTEDDDPLTQGDQGASVGVVRAWEYLRHTGLPPANGVWQPARIMIIDDGFDLDPVNGMGNADFLFNPPPQLDLQDFDSSAEGGGPDSNWHGQGVFGVCCAFPRNLFGGAGTSGEYGRPTLIRTPLTTSGVASAVRSSWLMGADVINISLGANCNWLCDISEFLNESHVQEEIVTATVYGASVFAAAGNGLDANIDDVDFIPCKFDHVTCVGSIDSATNNVYNWGNGVDIWAPTGIYSTVSPDSADPLYGGDANDVGLDELKFFEGTSASSPFAAGIAGLLKTADPSLRWDEVEQVLQDTANQTNDSHVQRGYVDALRAVQAVRPNPPPTAQILFLNDGDTKSWNQPILFYVAVTDPPAPNGFVGSVVIESGTDGFVCSAEGDANVLACEGNIRTLGQHVVTATATDEFGAESIPDSVTLEIVNRAPSLTVLSPLDGSAHFSDQLVPFRAQISDPDFESFEVTCPAAPGFGCIEWISDIDGNLVPPPGSDVLNFAHGLSVGNHMITVNVVDGKGAMDQEVVNVSISAGAGIPTAFIVSAPSITGAGQEITLEGDGTDPEDGALPEASLEWSSDVQGFLGTGRSLPVILQDGGCESTVIHTITLTVTDSAGNVDVDQVVISVVVIC